MYKAHVGVYAANIDGSTGYDCTAVWKPVSDWEEVEVLHAEIWRR